LSSSDSYSEVVKNYIAVEKMQVKEKLPKFRRITASPVEKLISAE
jgi:hypothetical protein